MTRAVLDTSGRMVAKSDDALMASTASSRPAIAEDRSSSTSSITSRSSCRTGPPIAAAEPRSGASRERRHRDVDAIAESVPLAKGSASQARRRVISDGTTRTARLRSVNEALIRESEVRCTRLASMTSRRCFGSATSAALSRRADAIRSLADGARVVPAASFFRRCLRSSGLFHGQGRRTVRTSDDTRQRARVAGDHR